MKLEKVKRYFIPFALLLWFCAAAYTGYARMGGAGGHGYGGGGRSYGGYSRGGNGYGYGYYGGGMGFSTIIFLILIVVVVYMIYMRSNNANAAPDDMQQAVPGAAGPEGLDDRKVGTAFFAVQEAWQRKDLSDVRKWLSDGMYQRLSIQFKMMEMLEQSNTLQNIRINRMAVSNTTIDGNYQTADIAISFTMDDRFTSNKFPQFNEAFYGDTDVEYWTFIKRGDGSGNKNLYDNNNCPNWAPPLK